jgi:hypothetical protein
MKTYGYLLNDESNPPKLWELVSHPHYEIDGLVTFNDPQDPAVWGWTLKSNVWEICTF